MNIGREACFVKYTLPAALVYSHTLQEPSALKWNAWAFYEWLISFEGGFVRRGLTGYIIQRVKPASEIEIVNIVVFGQFFIFVVISIAFCLIFVVGIRATVLFVLCPLSFLGMAIGNHYYYRKEIIFYIGIFGVAALMAFLRDRDAKLVRGGILMIIALWSMVGPFIHEGFIFYCVPIFGLIIYKLVDGRFRTTAVLCYLTLSLFLFSVMVHFAGGEAAAKQIWQGLSHEARSLSSSTDPVGGISAIGWSARYAISLTASALISGLAAYYIFSLIIIYLVIALIVSAQRGLPAADVVASPSFISGFALIIISFLPLFVVAWDWGRVICGVYIVSLVFFSLRLDDGVAAGAARWLPVAARPALLTAAGLVILWFTKIPECCIRTIDGNRAPWSAFYFVRKLLD